MWLMLLILCWYILDKLVFFSSHPCSSRVHTPTLLHSDLGLFPTAAPSAISERTTPTCISTWPSTIRPVSRTRWSASRPGTVDLSRFSSRKGLLGLHLDVKMTAQNDGPAVGRHWNTAKTGLSVSVADGGMQTCSLLSLYWVSLPRGKNRLPKRPSLVAFPTFVLAANTH